MSCYFCGDPIEGLPYTCKLCNQKHCSKHRLPENHECLNLSVYDSPEYKKQRVAKAQELAKVKSAAYSESFTSTTVGPRIFNQAPWTSGNMKTDVMIAGLVIGFATIFSTFINRESSAVFSDPIILLVILTSSIIGMYGTYFFRRVIARRYGINVHYYLYLLWMGITLILSFIFILPFFGFFIDDGGTVEGEAKAGLATIYSYLGYVYITRFLVPLIPFVPNFIKLGMYLPSEFFIWLALFDIIPWGDVWDGTKIYRWDKTYFWLTLILVVGTLLINFIF